MSVNTPNAPATKNDVLLINNQQQMKRYFVARSRIQAYLHVKRPDKGYNNPDFFFLATVSLCHLKTFMIDIAITGEQRIKLGIKISKGYTCLSVDKIMVN